MTNLQIINTLATAAKIENVVIGADGDHTVMEAIAYLSSDDCATDGFLSMYDSDNRCLYVWRK